jgi:hypothetical protein
VATSYLTNQELIAQLTLRDDLTDLEQNLLDRLILAHDECERLEQEVTRLAPPAASAAPAG